MAVQNPLLDIFTGGQMTDLPSYPGGIDLTALVEIVSPGTAAAGVNYSITSLALAALLNGAQFGAPTIIKAGPSYASVATDTRILSNLTLAGALTVTMLASSSYAQPILIKDIAGNVSAVNTLTINFSGGQLMDGLPSVTLTSPYQWIWLNPLASGGFYET
jgi:hypothetical protein